jgi:oligo-1,6-glucosidase
MAYHFEGMDIGRGPEGYKLTDFKRIYTRWDSAFAQKGWLSIYLASHDQPRMLSKFGDDRPAFRAASAKLLNTFILTMRGTPYCYNGDELGMTNIRFNNISDYRDVETINGYRRVQNQGGDLNAFLATAKRTARDNCRTPFQWDATANAGFTTGKPWLKINPNYPTVNQATEDQDPNSILNYFRKATTLRTAHKVLVYGQYHLLDAANPHVYAYTRTMGPEKALVVLNFTSNKRNWPVPAGLEVSGQPWLNNYPTFASAATLALEPWQALVLPLR